jgi:hypothetical protein
MRIYILMWILFFCLLTNSKQGSSSLVNPRCFYNNQPIILDLVVAFDVSPSISSLSFDLAKKALLNITQRFNTENRLGNKHFINLNIFSYSKTGTFIGDLIKNQESILTSRDKIIKIVQPSVKQTSSGLYFCLNTLRSKVLNEIRGGAPRVLLILSDGVNDELDSIKAEQEADTWKQMNIKIFTIALSSQINQQHLVKIASDSKSFLIFDDYEQIYDRINRLTVETCNANAFRFA